MIAFTGSCTAAVGVTDLDRGVAFYRDVLAFEVVAVMPDHAWAQLRSPVAGLAVGLGSVEEVAKGGGATLTFEVEDLDSAHAELEAAQVPFDGDTLSVGDELWIATFFDPDGNQLMLTEHRESGR